MSQTHFQSPSSTENSVPPKLSNTMFNPTVAAFLAALSFSSLASASVIQPRDEVVMFNGQNVTFNYTDSIVPEGSLFGMGLLRTGALVPLKVTSEKCVQVTFEIVHF